MVATSAMARAERCARSELIELLGQPEVLFRQAPFRMGGESQRHFVPPDVDVGMVPGFFGPFGDGVDKFDRGNEILELKCTIDAVPLFDPSWKEAECGFGLRC